MTFYFSSLLCNNSIIAVNNATVCFLFSKTPGPVMSKNNHLSPIMYDVWQKQNEWKIRNRELQEILDGRTDGWDSQQKATAFPDNHLSSLFVENCLFTCNTGVVQHYYGNLKVSLVITYYYYFFSVDVRNTILNTWNKYCRTTVYGFCVIAKTLLRNWSAS